MPPKIPSRAQAMAVDEPEASSSAGPDTNKAGGPDADVGAAVEDLLNTLSTKISNISSEIFAKMDDMSRRLEKLETALMENQGPKSNEEAPASTSQS